MTGIYSNSSVTVVVRDMGYDLESSCSIIVEVLGQNMLMTKYTDKRKAGL